MNVRHGMLAASLVLFVGCGSSNPTEPEPEVTPTPKPTATPAPTPAPSATPRASSCLVPPMGDHGNCAKQSPVNEYRTAVNASIDEVIQQRPDIFDFSKDAGGGSWYVTNRSAYMRQVLNRLNARGFCTTEGQDEIGLKVTNDFNEQWNIITQQGYVRRAYKVTCVPAAF